MQLGRKRQKNAGQIFVPNFWQTWLSRQPGPVEIRSSAKKFRESAKKLRKIVAEQSCSILAFCSGSYCSYPWLPAAVPDRTGQIFGSRTDFWRAGQPDHALPAPGRKWLHRQWLHMQLIAGHREKMQRCCKLQKMANMIYYDIAKMTYRYKDHCMSNMLYV